MSAQHTLGPTAFAPVYDSTGRLMASVAAWPFIPRPLPAPIKFDSLHCSEDTRVRVATISGKFFVSVGGDNFCGPFKTFEAAQTYGAKATRTTP